MFVMPIGLHSTGSLALIFFYAPADKICRSGTGFTR